VDRLTALSLPLQSVPAGSEGALVAEIKAAESKNKPILVMFWSPHWLHAEVDLNMVELPPYEEGCTEDPSVGLNPDATYDCDWARGNINKIGWIGMEEKWPAAFQLLQSYTLRNEDQIPMMAAIDVRGEDLDTVIEQWVDANEATWKPWVDAATQ
jgi:glycine betaine/proline transport system substrate-binding protein